MSSNIELKKVQTDITSTTEDISIRKQQKTNTLIENQSKNKNEPLQLILLEKNDKNKRKDIYGNVIKKGGKHKISFIDDPILNNMNNKKTCEEDNEGVGEVIDIESYKKYNKLLLFDHKKEIYPSVVDVCCEVGCIII